MFQQHVVASPNLQIGLNFQVFTEMNAVETLWRAFEKQADCTVFQSFDWLTEWLRHVGKQDTTPVIVLGLFDNVPVFILPLAIERRGITRRLVWLGSDLCDYNAPLLAKDFAEFVKPGGFYHVWRDVTRAIRAEGIRFDVVALEKMPDIVDTQPNPFLDLPVLVANFSGHVATLTDTWEGFYAQKVPASHQHNDRRKLRNLKKQGEIKFVEARTPQDLEHTLAALVAQKRVSYARMGVPDVFSHPGYLDFYQAIIKNPRLRDVVHVTRLDIGDMVAAATGIGLIFNSCYSLVMSSYEQDLAKHSPGRTHMHEMFRYTIARKMKKFDFTIGDEPYKFEWSDINLRLLSFYESSSAMGRVAVSAHNTFHRVDTWYHQTQSLKLVVSKARRWFYKHSHLRHREDRH